MSSFGKALGATGQVTDMTETVMGIGNQISGMVGRSQAGERADQRLQMALDQFEENKKRYDQEYALQQLWNNRNFDMKEKQLLSQLSQADQATRQNTLNRMQNAYSFENTKQGIENKRRTGKAFTRGILNAISHVKQGG